MPEESREVDGGTTPSGNLAPVSLGLGAAGLLLGLVPFYGTFFALPLSVVALVLGLTARGRPSEHRGQATAGLVTGGLGLLLVAAWAGWMGWRQLGPGTFSSQMAVEVGTEEALPPVTVGAEPGVSPSGSATGDGPAHVSPAESGDTLVTGLSGEANVTVGEQRVTMELVDCAMAEHTGAGTLLRAEGPDGRLAAAQPAGSNAFFVDIRSEDGPTGVYTGTVRGLSSQGGGGLIRERRQFEIEGRLHDVYSGDAVDVSVAVVCS